MSEGAAAPITNMAIMNPGGMGAGSMNFSGVMQLGVSGTMPSAFHWASINVGKYATGFDFSEVSPKFLSTLKAGVATNVAIVPDFKFEEGLFKGGGNGGGAQGHGH